MTNQDDGGSQFVQTPAPDIPHHHFHHDVHHRRDAADAHLRMHLHHHQHNQPAPKTPDPELDPSQDQDQDQDLRQRQIGELDDYVTRVIRTVSVINYLDGNGSIINVSTVFSPPVTVVIDETTGKTSTLSPAGTLSSDSPLPPAATASSVLSPGSSPVSLSLPTPSSTSTSTSTSTSSGFSSSTSSPTTPAPATFLSSLAPSSRNSTTFPSVSGSFNSSSSSTALPFSNSTVRSFFANSSSSTQTSISFTTSESSSTSSTSFSLPSTSSSQTTSSSSTTSSGTGGSLGGPGGGAATPTAPVAAPAPASGSPTSTPAIVGGVVGSICGVALLIFAIVFLLRWRKQQLQEAHKRLGEGDPAPPGSSGTAGGFSTRMSQRGAPFSVPSALAALSGAGAAAKQITSPRSGGGEEETSERGFYRVSGRKLPSVLRHGGDGYTNPHTSVMSDESEIMYRDSQTFFSGAGGTRLAVGSPMRPESGIAVMNPGPARTPVAGQSPHLEASPTMSPPPAMASNPATPRDSLVPPPLRPTPPPSRIDAIGRSRPSMDGSRVSSSRFSEHLS